MKACQNEPIWKTTWLIYIIPTRHHRRLRPVEQVVSVLEFVSIGGSEEPDDGVGGEER
jgi:hypothetical protein